MTTTRDALLLAARLAIDTNGGPIDSDSTIDGKAYVMVERSAFDGLAHAIDAAIDKARNTCEHRWKVTHEGVQYMDSRCDRCGATKRETWD